MVLADPDYGWSASDPHPATLATVGETAEATALQQAIRQFLRELEGLGRDVGEALCGLGLAPWLVSAAAAVVAYELGRRKGSRPLVLTTPLPGDRP
jgi:hypothetical protein